jgi:hypothetical protein
MYSHLSILLAPTRSENTSALRAAGRLANFVFWACSMEKGFVSFKLTFRQNKTILKKAP